MSLEQTIKDSMLSESVDLDMRLQQLVRAGLMPANTIPLLRKAISKIQGGYPLQGAERDIMANFLNSMMFIVLGDDAIFNKARVGAKSYATEAKDEREYGYEGDMAISQLKSISRHAEHFMGMLKPDTDLPEWVQSKITLAADYISTAHDYMMSEVNEARMAGVAPGSMEGDKHMCATKVFHKEWNEGTPIKTMHAKPDTNGLIEWYDVMFDHGIERVMIEDMEVLQAESHMHSKKKMGEEVEEIEEKRGLWDNIRAKRNRIKAGSGESMRKPGSDGAPSDANLKGARLGDTNEDLRKWFDQKWVRMDTTGKIKGDCAREDGEGKPKCLPQATALSMDKDDRAKAARRKRREDPVADRKGKGGKPINVATEEYIAEKNAPTNPALWSRAKSLARSKFDVYPSAYANGWASKWYKSKGGGWKSVSEETVDEACWDTHKQVGMKKKGNKMVPNCVPANEDAKQIDELSKGKLQSYIDKAKTKPGEVVANANDPASMKKYGNRLNGRIRAGRKLLAKESRRTDALADIAAITQMNESYKTTFDAALTQYGIKSPSELDEEKRKQFFNFVDKEYKKGDK